MSQQHQLETSDQPMTAVIITGGSPLLSAALEPMPQPSFIIAADSGLDHALAAGLRPDLVVGDLDSVHPSGIAWARQHHVPIEVHPADKDVTDTQLALGAAWSRQIERVVLISGGGDRLDHAISAISALGHPSLADFSTEARWGQARIFVLHGPGYWELDIGTGETFSLLTLHGECARITMSGARWPLTDATIEPGSSLGVSNVATDATIHLSVGSGVLTVIVPHAYGGSV